jgi:hypothetical protein
VRKIRGGIDNLDDKGRVKKAAAQKKPEAGRPPSRSTSDHLFHRPSLEPRQERARRITKLELLAGDTPPKRLRPSTGGNAASGLHAAGARHLRGPMPPNVSDTPLVS